ncbi:TPA: DUF3182 family protein [Pseudomonas putida]|jgi:hypothetical protein|uniref:DUF3182 family protein n=1 Tax=Pseudomonas putida (strain GB-1) TaxID=76869 RepID=B0KJC4_PSEPG|nr:MULTISPECIES: DUF3182 family protein [Pseudomonas]ABY97763.1 conserved hypothetical protein [Pseudomonas putida GB-1]APE98143.1 hypothetical protein BG030_08910 [Pseudomonas putida]MBP0710681.1 DUF3182 family protein [Pseudomonas sp. T34]MCE1003632.1 DUF3182 family protein [Pseudomonas sp. NMI1173_11]MCK2190128.1 DUF3182 family protein [Pseudomonas sp. MB04B]
MTMPSASEPKAGVVLLDTRDHTPEHEHAVHLKLADGLAGLLGCPHVKPTPSATAVDGYYYLPTETLIDARRQAARGIRSEQDLFGGLVDQPYMATKAISHPLPAGASFPPGWTDDFARQASDALLRGYTVFSKADARTAAQLLLLDGPVRVKPVLACAGRGQQVITLADALEPLLAAMDDQQLARWGLVLEEDLSDVQTFSVGQVRVAGLTCSYHGTQQLTRDHQGTEVYGGSDLVVVRGDYQALLQLPMEEHLRLAINQAITYEQAAEQHFPGFIASRRNYDIARGLDSQGHLRSGVLEQSWRLGGASSAELLALQAFADDPALQRVRASTHEVFGTPDLPTDATLFYQGNDSELGQLSKFARIREHDHSE